MADPVVEPRWQEVQEGAVATVDDGSDILNFHDTGDDNVNIGSATGQYEILTENSIRSHSENVGSNDFRQVVEEEIVELEFEKVKPKLATHSMHCPNCESEITKVILRRKVLSYRFIGPAPEEPRQDQEDVVGCFSCLSLFTCSDDGCFNPFGAFRRRTEMSTDRSSRPDEEQKTKLMVRENESSFSMSWVTGKDQPDPPQVNQHSISAQVQPPKYSTSTGPKLEDEDQPEPASVNHEFIINYGQVQAPQYVTETTSISKEIFRVVSAELPESSNAEGYDDDDDTTIIIENEQETIAVVARRRSWLGYEGVLVEIIKSIVYGGLLEVIASSSVVASAAASNAATLCIVSLGIASVIGGVFIIGHNIWDLRDDCYKDSSSQETKYVATNKYLELLGQVNYFPLHVFFAMLSFLVFGMVPPVAYGYSFHKTNDKEFTLMVAAIACLLCVLLLAILKAYVIKCKVFEYFKTVMYYIIILLSVSGVSYVVGKLIARLVDELGWFDTSSGGGTPPCLTRTTTPFLESF